jgi:ATP sulfurylase
MSRDLIPPHGGTLTTRWADARRTAAILEDAARVPSVVLDGRQLADLELLANGAYSPLSGFMGRDDLESVLERSRLASGIVFPIPVVLAVQAASAARLAPGGPVGLRDGRGALLAVIDLREIIAYDREDYARKVFGTADAAHPGVRRALEQGDRLLAGPVTVARRPPTVEFPEHHLDPAQTRALIRERGWRTVVGFQTRNPIHRAHEFILKAALEIFDALLVQPIVGETRPEDIPARARLRCIEVLLRAYYPAGRTLLAVLPAAMRFAGPREAVFHAIVRKNYGCTHFIVGRDHAGAGGFYGPYDAQRIFDAFAPEEIGIVPLRFEDAFYCSDCQGMASSKTCPHPEERRTALSGTRLREMLARREMPPPEITRPEVARVLMESLPATAPA